MVWVISILLGIACVGFLIKAIDPNLGKKKWAPFLGGKRAGNVSGSRGPVANEEAHSVKKKATVRIGLPPKPSDTKQTIRIQLPAGNIVGDVKDSGESKAPDLDKGSLPAKRKAIVRISMPSKPGEESQTKENITPSQVENVAEAKDMRAKPQESMPAPMVPGDAFHFVPPREGCLEEEYLGSSRIVIGPVMGRPYWLIGLNVIAIFEGPSAAGSHLCFNCGGYLFYLDGASRCIRLPTDCETHVVPAPVAASCSSGMKFSPRESAMIKPPDMGSLDVVQRMRGLTYMYEELLIDNEEYARRKTAILDEI